MSLRPAAAGFACLHFEQELLQLPLGVGAVVPLAFQPRDRVALPFDAFPQREPVFLEIRHRPRPKPIVQGPGNYDEAGRPRLSEVWHKRQFFLAQPEESPVPV